jgi:hypothetical protein
MCWLLPAARGRTDDGSPWCSKETAWPSVARGAEERSTAIDQVLLELFAGQRLLEPAAGPAEPVARPAVKTNARRRKRPAASGSRDG